jgi:hypothetical protein
MIEMVFYLVKGQKKVHCYLTATLLRNSRHYFCGCCEPNIPLKGCRKGMSLRVPIGYVYRSSGYLSNYNGLGQYISKDDQRICNLNLSMLSTINLSLICH